MSDKKSSQPVTYKSAGVDVEAGDRLVKSIGTLVKQTHGVEVISEVGGFGGLFKPDFTRYETPVLVSSVDGVGTKLIAAFKSGVYDSIGRDLVNHCVNDIAVCGAEPLFFLDYFSTGKLDEAIARQVIGGFAAGCRENACALIGGETAEMPDIYKEGEFDLAGSIVGIVDEAQIISGRDIRAGDLLIGLKSSGLHTNGYSLARKVLFNRYEIGDIPKDSPSGKTIGQELLEVHRSYLPLIRQLKSMPGVHGFSHITGGGIAGNTSRILPDGLKLAIDWQSWPRPFIFELIQQEGKVPEEAMRQAFNLGIGLVVVVSKSAADSVISHLAEQKEPARLIGEVTAG